MKKRKWLCRLTALALILMLLMPGAGTGADENDPDAQAPVFSEWLSLSDLLEAPDALPGSRNLRRFLREAALLDADGNLLAKDSVWSVNPDAAYQVLLRFRETPGSVDRQFDTGHAPLVYRLPEGLSVGDKNLVLPVRVGLDSGESVEAVCACDAAAGTLSVSWDPDSAAPDKIGEAESAGFEVVIPAVFGNVHTLAFADQLTVILHNPRTEPLPVTGEDYVISLACTEKAEIPAGSRLAAAELNENDPRYQTFLDESARFFGCNPEDLTHSRLFEILIAAPDSSAVQPADPVQVRVGYASPLRFKTPQRFLAAHFGKNGIEFLEPTAGYTADGLVDSFTFEASSFSLYGIAAAPRGGSRSAPGHSSDLADFLDSIVITGAELNEQGQYVILQDVPYTIQMYFSETAGSLQFDDDPESGGLVYHFPNGFTPLPTSGTVEMTGETGVMRCNYVISGNTLTILFDETSPGYEAFLTSETVQIEIHATGVISEEVIEFSSEVTGEFDFDNTRDVTVNKVGTYDPELNRIRFTVQACSRGNNTNIHIGDIITGTALTYDPASLRVVSNISNPVQYTPDTREGETFGLTILSMAHGETVTVEYYADVDLSGLTSTGNGTWGTIGETGNSVWITSEEDPPGDDTTIFDEDFDHRISLSNILKSVSSQTEHDGKTYVTWTIVLNEYANISIAGSTVTDTIDALSQAFMRYSGQGIHIERYLKDGTPAGTSDIRWGTNGLSASFGGSTWTYTIPESDEGMNYRYVITYETEVDSDVMLTPTTVSNSVEDEYDSDNNGVRIDPTGDTVDAEKSVDHSVVDAGRKEAETEWVITFTVPADGLDSAVIMDSLPAFLNVAENRWYYDTYKPDSVRVGNGELLQGESFTVDSTSQEHQVIITFTRDGVTPGLTGTGLPRTIHVYLTTQASREWLEYAEEESRARTHVNNAIVRVNGQDLYVTSSVSYNTSEYDLEKLMTGKYATSTDPALPIYQYMIVLTNVNDNAFDDDGYLTITDTYDPEYLAYHPTYQTNDGYNVNTPNGHVYGNTQWRKYELGTRGPYVVASTEPAGQLVFRLNKNDLPMNQSSYYPYYAIAYSLQIKDAETLARMHEEALHSQGLKIELKNTARNEIFGTNTIVTDFEINVLDKMLDWEEDNSSTGTHDLHFTILVNQDGLKIGDGDTITVKDTLSSLSFDYTSITVEPQLVGDVLNRVGNSVIFTLHNETPYRITYTARLIGIHDVQWNNKADLYGQVSGVNGTSSSQSGGSGTYTNYSMNVKKYAEGNMNQGLAATFEIYEARVKDDAGHDIPNPAWTKVGDFTTDAADGLYQIRTVIHEGDTEAQSLRPYSHHDENGAEQFGASYGWRYRIRETVAPEGYQKIVEDYEFGISDVPSYIRPFNYLNGDTVTVVNQPIVMIPVEMEITGKKVLQGRELEDREFSFTLAPEEHAAAAWGEGYPGGFEGSLTAWNDGQGRFSFPLSFTYDDYVSAVEKGLADENQCVYFDYVVTENLPAGAENSIWNGVRYDDSRFLIRVKLFVEGGQLQIEKTAYPYDGTGTDTRI